MNFTKNNNLKKPAATEGYNIQDFNDNADTIDELLGKITNLSTKNKSDLVAAINELREQNDILDANKANLNKTIYRNNYAILSGSETLLNFIKTKIQAGIVYGSAAVNGGSDMDGMSGIVSWKSDIGFSGTARVLFEPNNKSNLYCRRLAMTTWVWLDNSWQEIVTTTQPAWITATLQNGWTGDLKYTKNDLGQIMLTGRILLGTLTAGTIVTTLPSGYRPQYYKPISVYTASGAQSVINGVVLESGGNLVIRSPANNELQGKSNIHISEIFK